MPYYYIEKFYKNQYSIIDYMNIKDIRIVYMGTPDFAAHILEGLVLNNYNIVCVVSQPDKIVGRKKVLQPSSTKQMAEKYNLPVLTPLKVRNEYEDILKYEPDLIITAAYGQIIPKALLDYPKYKCINAHGSLLPKHRGGAPIQRCLINGDTTTGMSIMYMDEKMDEGDILYQKQIPIDIHDTNSDLFIKLSDLALSMFLEFLPKFFEGDFTRVKQDHESATYSYNLRKEEEFISFNYNCLSVYNHIRGLLDNPGAYCILNDKKYKLINVFFEERGNTKANEFSGLENDYLVFNCTNGIIKVYKIQPEGKNIMSAKDFYNGAGRNLVGNYCKDHYE